MPDEIDDLPPTSGLHGQCPRCAAAMKIVRSVPKAGPMPELRTFQCPECDHVLTIEIEA